MFPKAPWHKLLSVSCHSCISKGNFTGSAVQLQLYFTADLNHSLKWLLSKRIDYVPFLVPPCSSCWLLKSWWAPEQAICNLECDIVVTGGLVSLPTPWPWRFTETGLGCWLQVEIHKKGMHPEPCSCTGLIWRMAVLLPCVLLPQK